MNSSVSIWTKRTQDLDPAAYVDGLVEIYGASSKASKEVPEEYRQKMAELYRMYIYGEDTGDRLIDLLYEIKEKYKRFPLKHPFAKLLEEREIRQRASRAKKLILEEIKIWGLDSLWAYTKSPTEANQRLGEAFRAWVKHGLVEAVARVFEGSGLVPEIYIAEKRKAGGWVYRRREDLDNHASGRGLALFNEPDLPHGVGRLVVFTGDDEHLLDYVRRIDPHLAEKIRSSGLKGVDFLALAGKWWVLGEAKFQSDRGGNQDNQVNVGLSFLETVGIDENKRIVGVFLLDGVPVLRRYNLGSKLPLTKDKIIMSALLLPDFLVELMMKEDDTLTF